MKSPAPLSTSQRWDKAKWHEHEAGELASRHIVAALAFLHGKKQLTPEGVRELRDGGDALLAEHVKPVARAFLDAAYDSYLAAEPGYTKTPPVKVLADAWKTYVASYDLTKTPKGTPLDALATKISPDEPTLRGIFEYGRGEKHLDDQLAAIVHAVGKAEAKLIAAYLSLTDGTAPKLVVKQHAAADLVVALGPAPDRSALATLALLKLGPKDDAALADAINGRPRKDWLKLAPAVRKRMRDAMHRLLKKDPHLAMCALRTAADKTTLPLVERDFPNEGFDEIYRETKKGVELARTEREYDDLRRAIRRVAT